MGNIKQRDIKKFIKLFADKTGCNIQHNKCPCNSCFHGIDANFNHICWLTTLWLRGDYNFEDIYNGIREELK